jgi:peptidoglycan-associated lipoprotein
MTRLTSLLFVVVGCLGISLATGCAKYPECSADEDCTKYSNDDDPTVAAQAKLTPYCVNKMCQQCRADRDCPRGNRCNANRCERIPGYCDSASECPSPQICRNNQCQLECTDDSACPPGAKCEANRCVQRAECASDEDCPTGKVCKSGMCVTSVVEEKVCQMPTVYYDFDKYDIRPDAVDSLKQTAACLAADPNISVTIEGHTDDRGTEEYNVALGERRASAAKKYLKNLGVSDKRLKPVSYGETRPVASGENEDAWQKNRRAEFVK